MKMKRKIFIYFVLLLSIVVTFSSSFTVGFQKKQMLNENLKFHQSHFDESVDRTQIILNELINVIESVGRNNLTLNYHVNDNPDIQKSLDDIEVISLKKEYLSGLIKDYNDVESILLFQDTYAFFGYNSNRAEVESPDSEDIKRIALKGREDGVIFGEYCLCRTEIYDEDQLALFRKFDEGFYIFIVLSNKFDKRINFPGEETYITDGDNIVRVIGEFGYNKADVLYHISSAQNGSNVNTKNSTISLLGKGKNSLDFSILTTIDVTDTIRELQRENLRMVWVPILAIIISVLCVYLFSNRLVGRINTLKNSISKDIPEKISSLKLNEKTGGKLYPRISIRISVFLLFLFTILLPIIAITIVSHASFVNVIEESLGNIIDNELSRVTYNLNFTMESYTKTVIGIASDSKVLESFDEYYEGDDNRTYEERQKEMTDHIFDRLFYREGIINISLYDNDHNLFYSYLQDGSASSVSIIEEDINEVTQKDPIKLWKGPYSDYFGNKYFRIGMRLRRPDDAHTLGFIFFDISLNALVNTVENTITSENTIFALLTETDEEIISMRSNMLSEKEKISIYEMVNPGYSKNETYSIYDYHVNAYRLKVNGWNTLCAVALTNYVNDYSRIVNWNLVLFFLYLGLALFFSLGFSLSLTRNIKLLEKGLLNLQPDNIKLIHINNSSDEVEELGEAFNILIERIDTLINEVYEERLGRSRIELKLKESQYNLLQSQINPHFLYNTLETIHFMIRQNDERAVKMVQMLGMLFRKGIGNGDKYVRLENELEYVKLYIQLQQMHYSDRLNVEYEIEGDLGKLFVLRFILQPVVENCILHGFEDMEDKGFIKISIRTMDEKLLIEIEDNGSGMDEKTLEMLRDQLDGKVNKRSVGLMNVGERIHLEYGEGFGIKVESRLEKGTKVMLVLPVIKQKKIETE